MLTKYGYIRVSSRTQENNTSLELQRQKLIASGICEENIIEDIKSGRTLNRPGLTRLLAKLCPGDVLVTVKIDRVARTLKQTFALQALLEQKGCTLECLEEKVERTTPAGKLTFALLAAASEYEMDLRKERIKAGIAAKKAQNYQYPGRKPRLSSALKKKFYAKKDLPGMSHRKLALELGISRQTLVNYLKEAFCISKVQNSKQNKFPSLFFSKSQT